MLIKLLKKLKISLNEFLVLIGLIIIGGWLRFYRLGATSLWKDEIFSLIRSEKPLMSILCEKLPFGMRAPLHHVFIHLALFFGKSEFVVRFPSVLFGVFSIVLIYELGRVIFNSRKVGLISAFLLTISPLHLEYSREARYYSFIVFFSSLSLLSFYKIIFEKRKRWIVFFSLVTFLNLMTHPTALLLLMTEVIFLVAWVARERQIFEKLSRFRIKKNLHFGILLIPIFVLGVVFIKDFNKFVATIRFSSALPPVAFLDYFFRCLNGSSSLSFFYLVFFGVGSFFVWKKEKSLAAFLLSFFFIPSLILYFLRPQGFGFDIRYVSFIVVPYFLIISYGIAYWLKHNGAILAAIFIFVLLSIPPIRTYYAAEKEDWRGVGEYLRQNADPGDVIITEGYFNKILLDYYLEAEKRGIVLQTREESIIPPKIPFRIFYLQHDDLREKKANPEVLSLLAYEEIISFLPEATVSPMYLFVFPPIWVWQEAENSFEENQGWEISEFWGKKVITTVYSTVPNQSISYQVEIPQDGTYDLFANLRWYQDAGLLKYKIDTDRWSAGFQPLYEKGKEPIPPLKEKKLGSQSLQKGKHTVRFLNESFNEGERIQVIDYFYLSLVEQKGQK